MTSNNNSENLDGPLSGYRIIEFGANMTVPMGTMWLGDQGADVIKVEPFTGDQFRHASAKRIGVEGMASVYATCNRNKRSVRMDLKKPGAVETILQLVKSADVVVQNYRPGVMERMGLGYEDLKRVKNDIIMVSVSGFGAKGPYSEQRVYDPVIQCISGMTFAQVNHDTGKPGIIQVPIVDALTSQNVFQAVTAALLAKERKGKGQHVQINMLQGALAFMWPSIMSNLTLLGDNVKLGASGSDARLLFQTKDHFIGILALSNKEWHGLCTAIEKEHLIEDPRFKELSDRTSRFKEQYEEFKEAFKHRTSAEWAAILKAHDVVFATVNTPQNVHLDPQVVESGLLVDSEHPHAGPYRQPTHPINFGGTPAKISKHAPMLGEHTDEILQEIGISKTDIEKLKTQGTI